MALLASFYNGISGINTMAEKMNVTANNVANVNTNSFKAKQVRFTDVYESTVSASTYLGHGDMTSPITTSFSTGASETTAKATDMAINGPGFFMLRREDGTAPDTYTRSGNFNMVEHLGEELNASNLVTPTGQFVQGYNFSASTGSPTVVSDILIKNIAPQSATSAVQVVLNLQNNPALTETTASPVNLFDSWDGTNPTQPIATDNYDYKSSLKIYGPGEESTGFTTPSDTYDLSIYFDATENPNEQEFLVTCNPAQDQRLSADGTSYTNTKGAGALLYGVLSFSDKGELNNIQCWNVPPDGLVAPTEANMLTLADGESNYSFDFNFTGSATNNSSTLNFGNTPKPQSVVSPVPAFSSATSSGGINATSPWNTVSDSEGNSVQIGDTITLQGLTRDGTAASYTYTVNSTETVQAFLDGIEGQFACTAKIVNGQLTLTDTKVGASKLTISSISYSNASGADPLTDPTIAQIFGDQGTPFTVDPGELYQNRGLATTNYASASTMLYQSQNGYGKGRLQDISVDSQGFITGEYSNGQSIKQAQLALANFINLQGLRGIGNNNYLASANAGPVMIGTAGQSSFGAVSNYNLEASNVDLGREMVDVITTQRAFQANAKSISTADDMYEKLIQMIR